MGILIKIMMWLWRNLSSLAARGIPSRDLSPNEPEEFNSYAMVFEASYNDFPGFHFLSFLTHLTPLIRSVFLKRRKKKNFKPLQIRLQMLDVMLSSEERTQNED